MKIGIDVDGTVTDNFELIKQLAYSHFKSQEVTSWDWDLCKVFNVTPEEVQIFWELHENSIYTIPGPKPYAIQVLSKLSLQHEIIYITARPKAYQEITINWLNSQGIFFGQIIMSKDKKTICQQQCIDVMVDDSPEYVCIANHVPLLLFDYPYNQQVKHHKVIRVKDWLEIESFINNFKSVNL